jgi:hypothetical protein
VSTHVRSRPSSIRSKTTLHLDWGIWREWQETLQRLRGGGVKKQLFSLSPTIEQGSLGQGFVVRCSETIPCLLSRRYRADGRCSATAIASTLRREPLSCAVVERCNEDQALTTSPCAVTT